jgi:hypothetical protein
MISFRDKEDVGPGIVSVLAIVILVAGFLFMLFVKPPTVADITKVSNKKQIDLKRAEKASKAAGAKSQILVNNLTWTGDAEYIGTTALQTANDLADKCGVKLTVFRPQKAALVDNLVTLPFVVTVEGNFPNILSFSRGLEDPKTKLAVTQIQVSSTDPNTDKVTANIGIVAYVNPKEEMPIDSSGSTLQSRLRHRNDRVNKNA